MKVTFGKHSGKSVELLMLKEPSYIQWVLNQQSPTGNMATVKSHIQHLISIFDSKPFKGKKCSSKSCDKPVTRYTVYFDNLQPYWWCDTCDPYQLGANSGKLHLPNDYKSALLHVATFCQGRKPDYTYIIKTLSQAKGLPDRVGESQAQSFFR